MTVKERAKQYSFTPPGQICGPVYFGDHLGNTFNEHARRGFIAGFEFAIEMLRSEEAEKELGTSYETEGFTACVGDWLSEKLKEEK